MAVLGMEGQGMVWLGMVGSRYDCPRYFWAAHVDVGAWLTAVDMTELGMIGIDLAGPGMAWLRATGIGISGISIAWLGYGLDDAIENK